MEQLASTVLGQALDAPLEAAAKRVGVIRTSKVATQTTLLLLRHRFHLTGRKGNRTWQTLAEELDLLAYAGRAPADGKGGWLDAEATRALLALTPEGNLDPVQKEDRLTRVLADVQGLDGPLMARAQERAAALLEAHERVRGAARGQGVTYSVEPPGPQTCSAFTSSCPCPNLEPCLDHPTTSCPPARPGPDRRFSAATFRPRPDGQGRGGHSRQLRPAPKTSLEEAIQDAWDDARKAWAKYQQHGTDAWAGWVRPLLRALDYNFVGAARRAANTPWATSRKPGTCRCISPGSRTLTA
ncbi:hypothetical protein MSS93_17045 (plasmid) [Deinococcus radiodurans]|nr:hypothetical protein MSS93_17045 [Deinococcus radiodurans]